MNPVIVIDPKRESLNYSSQVLVSLEDPWGKCYWTMNGFDDTDDELPESIEARRIMRSIVENDPWFPFLLKCGLDNDKVLGEATIMLTMLCDGTKTVKRNGDSPEHIITSASLRKELLDICHRAEAAGVPQVIGMSWITEVLERMIQK